MTKGEVRTPGAHHGMPLLYRTTFSMVRCFRNVDRPARCKIVNNFLLVFVGLAYCL